MSKAGELAKGKLAWLLAIWLKLSPIARAMRFTRVQTLSAFLGFAFLGLTSQGAELGYTLMSPNSGPNSSENNLIVDLFQIVLAPILLFAWALTCGIWAAHILDLAKGDDQIVVGNPKVKQWITRIWPRFLAIICLLAAAKTLWQPLTRISDDPIAIIVGFTILALIISLIAIFSIPALADKLPSARILNLVVVRPLGDWIIISKWFSYCIFFLFLFMQNAFPEKFGLIIGGPAIAFAFLASVCGILSHWASWAHKGQVPFLMALLVVTLVLSFTPWTDNHNIRRINDSQGVTAKDFPKTFDRLQQMKCADRINDLCPVIVATAGGGIRAAYWTSVILGSLHDEVPNFDKRLFAISGVSGGSVGAANYLATLSKIQATAPNNGERIRPKLLQAMSADFLGPALGGLLFTDLFQSFIPFLLPDDRAVALEKSLESMNDGFENGFLGYYGQLDKPLLFLNTTDAQTGKRVVISPVRFAEVAPEIADYFDPKFSVDGKMTQDLRLSTAAVASARFTYISPAATIKTKTTDKNKVEQEVVALRLIDGGYFENYGAETALDILNALEVLGKTNNTNIHPIVIQIVSDPEILDWIVPEINTCSASMGVTNTTNSSIWGLAVFASEFLSPANGLMNTREARGVLASKRLACRAVVDMRGKYFVFRMVPTPLDHNASWLDGYFFGSGDQQKKLSPPLGWLMGKPSRDQIEKLLWGDTVGSDQTKQTLNHLNSIKGLGADRPIVESFGSVVSLLNAPIEVAAIPLNSENSIALNSAAANKIVLRKILPKIVVMEDSVDTSNVEAKTEDVPPVPINGNNTKLQAFSNARDFVKILKDRGAQ